jgi:NAD(P)-dependent dehydrogenase (short-subunit alcohol dehydrogenase family)
MTVVLITGTSSGIGLEAAVQSAIAGHSVVATMRDLGRADALRAAATDAGVTLDIRRLDVTDASSIATCIDEVVGHHGSIDALVNNAGSGHLGTIELEGMDAVRAVMEVNFFGVVAMTKAVLPHLRASHGRVVTLTSVGGVVGQPFNEAYCAAKFAVEGFMEALAPVAATVGVRVTVVEPGAVGSEFVANVAVDVPSMVAAAGPYGPALTRYLERAASAFSAAQSPADAASAIVAVLGGENTAFRVQTSDGARAFVSPKLADTDGSAVLGLTRAWVGA